MIREATSSDVTMIVGLLHNFHAQDNPPYSFDADDTATFISNMIENPNAIVLVSDAGVICGFLAPCPVSFAWKIAMELYWWAEDGKGSQLMKSFKKHALDMGASEMRISCRASTPKIGSHLERTGFALDEQVYTRVN